MMRSCVSCKCCVVCVWEQHFSQNLPRTTTKQKNYPSSHFFENTEVQNRKTDKTSITKSGSIGCTILTVSILLPFKVSSTLRDTQYRGTSWA